MKAILQGFYQKEHCWLRLGVVLLAPFRLQEDDEGDDTAEHLNKRRKNGVTARTYCLKPILF